MTKSRIDTPMLKKRVNSSSELIKIAVPVLLNMAVLGISIFLFYNIGRSVYLAGQKLEILDRAEQEVVSLRLENIDLIMQKNEVTNPEFVEKEVRNRLNYAKENEIQLVIPNGMYKRYEQNEVLGVSTEQSNEASFETQAKLWIEFFAEGI